MFPLRGRRAMSTDTDHELVEKYLGGDHLAFHEIVTRHYPRLIWVATRISRNEHDAHDIVQDALLRASQKLDGFRGDAELSTWLHRLVTNSALDHVRAKSRQRTVPLDEDRNPGHLVYPHDPIHRVDLALMLRGALKAVRPDQAEALILVDAIGHSVAEVARAGGVAPGTVKSRRARAKARIRRELVPEKP